MKFEDEFKYNIPPTDVHTQLMEEMKAYVEENEKWMVKSFDAPGFRAGRHLQNIKRLAHERRQEIIATRKELK